MYYNTTNESGEQLKESVKKAKSQTEKVLEMFDNIGVPLSPSEVQGYWASAHAEAPPITSIRRAISDLTAQGFLKKTHETVTGMYGKQEHLWVRCQ